MGKKALPALVAALFALPSTAGATTLSGDSRTYFSSWESAGSDRHYTFYEYLDADLREIGDQRLSFHFGGWGRGDAGEESYGESSRGEFLFGYLNYASRTSNSTVRLGRFYVSDGIAGYEQMDGVSLGGDLAAGFSLSLYGGLPTETDDDDRSEDLIYGARLAQGSPGRYQVGLSYLKEEDGGKDFREEAGIDLYFRPFHGFAIEGQSSYNRLQSSWMEHDYRVILGSYKGWTFNGRASWVDYESFFQSPDVTAFQSPLIDLEESLRTLGGQLEYFVTPNLVLAADYTNYRYELSGDAGAYGARLTWTTPSVDVGLIYRRIDGDEEKLRYSEYRGYVSRRFGALDAVLDVLDAVYDEEINGVTDAYAVSLALGYDVRDTVRLAADVEYGSNPIFEEEVRIFVKLLYRFAVSSFTREDNEQ